MAGTISTLGIGSGIDLQGMLEQLREIDQQVVTRKESKVTKLEDQLEEFSNVNNKLFTMKSSALDLSLSSSFLGRTVGSSDETVATVEVLDGTPAQVVSLDIARLASNSSWMSTAGAADADTSVYVPTKQESTTGVADPAVDIVASAGESMTINFGSAGDQIVLNIAGDTTMDGLVTAINTDAANVGAGANGRLVTAETYVVNGETFLRVQSDIAGGTGEDNRVAISEDFAALDFAAPDKTLFYKIGDGDPVSVAVAADTTITELAALINNDSTNPGVTAKVINDGDPAAPYRLSMRADGSGEDNRISFLSQLDDLSMGEVQGASAASLNAQFAVDGINYQRQSNSVGDIVSGLTITLEDVGTSTITIDENNTQVEEMIDGLVTAYNEAVQLIREDTSYNAELGEFGILGGTTIRDLPYELQNLMTSSNYADTGGNINSLFDLGLEVARDGTISLNKEVLTKAIEDNSAGVSAFFLGDSENGVEGFADKVNDRLRSLTRNGGQIEAESSAAQARIDGLQLKIEQENQRLDKKYDLLAKQFVELDRYMNQMTSLSDYLATTFDGMSKGWGTGSN